MLSQDALIHVTTKEAWQGATDSGYYYPPGFDAEGFIHCCTRSQLERVLDDHFSTHNNVLLLVIERSLIASDMRFERASSGEVYLHIYGPIEPSAVTELLPATRSHGEWRLP